MAISPTPPSGEESGMAPIGKPETPLGPQQNLTPKEAAKVFEKVLVKELLLQTMRQMRKEQAKQKEIEREDVYGN